MAFYIIAARLTGETSVYRSFFSELEQYRHRQLSDTTYLVESHRSAGIIYQTLRPHINVPGDTLVVISVALPGNAHGPNELLDWMKEKLPMKRHLFKRSSRRRATMAHDKSDTVAHEENDEARDTITEVIR